GRPILRSEIDQPTPYNTYVIDGLPPGPIANPGRASLEAAANPARTKELYFVADGTGGHAVLGDLGQHHENSGRTTPPQQHKEAPPAAPALAPAPAPAPTTATRQQSQAPARTAPAPIRITPAPSRQSQESKPARTGEAPQSGAQ